MGKQVRELYWVVLVQSLGHVWLFETQWTIACQASLSFTTPGDCSTHIHWLSGAIQPSHPLSSLLLLSSIFPSIRVFSKLSVLRIRWPKHWSFSLSISPSKDYSGLTSFRIDWFDLLGVQGTLKNLFQHHSSKASILRCSAFFVVQLLYPYMATRKTTALTRQTFVSKG